MSEKFYDIYEGFYGGEVQKPDSQYFFSRKSLPNLDKINVNHYVTDPDIIKLWEAMIRDTPAHRMKLFLADNTATSYSNMSSSVMVGENIIVTVEKNPEAEEIIETWNDNINAKHQTIETLLKTSFTDNLMNADSIWRVYVDPEEEPKVDVQRISFLGLQKETHPTRGVVRWVQKAQIPKYPLNKAAFYSRDPTKNIEYKQVVTTIPNEPNCVLRIKLFDTPPTSTILKELLIKRWCYWFLRKYIEKYWAPFIIASVGDPKNGYMPKNPQEMNDSLQWAAKQIRMVRDFGGAAFPATTQLNVLDTKSKRDSNIYLETIDHLSKEIAIGLHASIATRDPKGKSKAGQDIAQASYLRTMRGFREVYNIILRRFYAQVLLPAYGIKDVKPRDIKVSFPELQLDDTKKILEAVQIAAKIGAFKDWKEIRKILNPLWKHIDDKISDKEMKEMKNLFMEINSPSRAEGDVPQARTGSNKSESSE